MQTDQEQPLVRYQNDSGTYFEVSFEGRMFHVERSRAKRVYQWINARHTRRYREVRASDRRWQPIVAATDAALAAKAEA